MLVQSATHGKHLDNIYSAEIYISVHEQSSAVLFLGLHRTEVAYLFTKDTDVNEQLSSQGLSIANSSNPHPPEWQIWSLSGESQRGGCAHNRATDGHKRACCLVLHDFIYSVCV